ncbi:MAG: right-handed parallel beta-helix repeat-containing protein, partial [Armatimonadota bacterium]|nr:right-handed parallel beta-helix repeat-containing protein [Armatimonadota bacterium]
GTAYAGWEHASDCLMENVTTYKLRHAPCVQWAASGCVIRKSTFHESDGQWHSGWTNENLFEQCVIDSRLGNGGYGFGLWASPPEDTAHGPNGPRNVVYNCDVRSVKAGLWMGGMNENWLILYNRFIVGSGPGVFAKTASFDHIIRGNVFCLADAKQPAVFLATPDCIGIELIDNRVYGGSGRLFGGSGRPQVDRGNQLLPAGEGARPTPAVPSIFEWQRARARR